MRLLARRRRVHYYTPRRQQETAHVPSMPPRTASEE